MGGTWDRADKQYLGYLLEAFVEQDNIPYNWDNVIDGMKKIVEKYEKIDDLNSLSEYINIKFERTKMTLISKHKRVYELEL